MIKKILCFVGVVAALLSLVLVPVSAAEFSVDNTIVSYDPILDQYPYSNMLPFPYRFRGNTVVSGITITSGSDYYLTFDGISSAVSYNVISRMNLPVGTYTLTGCPFGTTGDMWTVVRTPQGNNYRNGDKITFNVVNESDLIEVLVCVANGYVVDLVSFRPMLAKGSTPLAWSPYLPYVFDQYSNSGYDEGKTDGYNEGVVAGRQEYADLAENEGRVDFFMMPELKLEVEARWIGTTNNVASYTNNDFSFVYSDGVLTVPTLFETLWAFVEPYSTENAVLDFLHLKFYFDRPDNEYGLQFFPITENVGLNIVNRSNNCLLYGFACHVVETSLNDLTVGDVNVNNQGVFSSSDLGKSFKIMDIFLLDIANSLLPSWVRSLTFATSCYAYSDIYNAGLIAGYQKGLEVEGQVLYDQGKAEGYREGKAEGYQNGYAQGREDGITISNNGSFVNLFTAVAEAPINSLMGILDFEILGLDMKAAFGAIVAVCLVIIIVKKVI